MQWFRVGRIVNTHGIKGEMRIQVTTDFPEERFASGEQVYAFVGNEEHRPLTVHSCRPYKKGYLLVVEEVKNLTEAESLKNLELWVPESHLHELEDGEYYQHEIRDCQVYTASGDEIGRITDILQTGANDVWIIRPSSGGKDVLIPYIDDVVRHVDVEQKKVVIDLIEGLIDE
ncbi:ribosome maturation factor RimM [Bacillaceae bacterium SIJ1]|uniref:ribosome maturation factor RimM n=1 Tax=Litoribacterium kuwaitense TaxID=1398745 RepID=UPI0013EE17D6|nr:ribosome maturation factor RimM [Litoribacterium kuwaitense]NGP44148.1 ribosome maturation factor RimM [Litoribacterium kuwaitense]